MSYVSSTIERETLARSPSARSAMFSSGSASARRIRSRQPDAELRGRRLRLLNRQRWIGRIHEALEDGLTLRQSYARYDRQPALVEHVLSDLSGLPLDHQQVDVPVLGDHPMRERPRAVSLRVPDGFLHRHPAPSAHPAGLLDDLEAEALDDEGRHGLPPLLTHAVDQVGEEAEHHVERGVAHTDEGLAEETRPEFVIGRRAHIELDV